MLTRTYSCKIPLLKCKMYVGVNTTWMVIHCCWWEVVCAAGGMSCGAFWWTFLVVYWRFIVQFILAAVCCLFILINSIRYELHFLWRHCFVDNSPLVFSSFSVRGTQGNNLWNILKIPQLQTSKTSKLFKGSIWGSNMIICDKCMVQFMWRLSCNADAGSVK